MGIWLSIDMMITQILILFMYKIHNKRYLACCGRAENFCVRPRFLQFFACNFYCIKMDENIMNNAVSVPKESPISEMTEGAEQIELEVDCPASTRKGNTPRPTPTHKAETAVEVCGGKKEVNIGYREDAHTDDPPLEKALTPPSELRIEITKDSFVDANNQYLKVRKYKE